MGLGDLDPAIDTSQDTSGGKIGFDVNLNTR